MKERNLINKSDHPPPPGISCHNNHHECTTSKILEHFFVEAQVKVKLSCVLDLYKKKLCINTIFNTFYNKNSYYFSIFVALGKLKPKNWKNSINMRFLLIKPYQGLMILQFTKNIKEKTFFWTNRRQVMG